MENTYTLTLGDVAENHVGMEKLGKLSARGLSCEALECLQNKYEQMGFETNLVNLGENFAPASLLIVRKGLVCANEMYREQEQLEYDTKALMRGTVKNKRARHNLCFSTFSREPNYAAGLGRVVNLESVPFLKEAKDNVEALLETKEIHAVEGNKYFGPKCYIGYHGDAERRIAIGFRLGKPMKLKFLWHVQCKPAAPEVSLLLEHGDIYFMSEKATGFDWRKRLIPTLRHSAVYT